MTGYMYTIREMARQMDMSVTELREARRQGVGPDWVRINRRVLYPEAALHAWIERSSGVGLRLA